MEKQEPEYRKFSDLSSEEIEKLNKILFFSQRQKNFAAYLMVGMVAALFSVFTLHFFGWTYTYDTDTPVGTDAPSVIDDKIREVKDGVQERQNVDHYWPLTGSQVSDADAGKHRQVTFRGPLGSDPTVATDEYQLYTKDVSSVAELHGRDESNSGIQLTSGGYLLGSSILDGSLLTADIADANVTNAKLADDSVDSNDIVSGAIDSRHFSASAVMTDDIADANVTAAKIANLTPDDYASDGDGDSRESMTYPNGKIVKSGYIARSGTSTAVTFATAFPNGVVSAQVSIKASGFSGILHPISAFSISGMTIIADGTGATGYYWEATGY